MSSEDSAGDSEEWVYYAYKPNEVLPWVALSLFAVCSAVHLFWWYRARFSRAYIALYVGTLAECAGYATRHKSIQMPTGDEGLTPFVIQNLLIILAPVALALSLYQVYGRTVLYAGAEHSPIRASRVTWTFITFDIISFCVQGAGGSLATSSKKSSQNAAKGILIIGFLIQIIAFGLFLIMSFIYRKRARRAGVRGSYEKALLVLWLAGALILIRSIFRTVEYASGTNGEGYLLTHEPFYYGLETLPILLACWLLAIFHPSPYIPHDKSVRMADVEKPVGMQQVNGHNQV